MFLKSESLELGGETLTLNELSALSRIELLEYMAKEDAALPIEGNDYALYACKSAMQVKIGARIIALSLCQRDIQPSMSRLDIDAMTDARQLEVLRGWPVSAIGEADRAIKRLSGMLPPEPAEPVDDSEQNQEPLSAEKSSPAS